MRAGVEGGAPLARAKRLCPAETAREITRNREMSYQPTCCLRAGLRLEREMRVIQPCDDPIRQLQMVSALFDACSHSIVTSLIRLS
jgi:hypothetical protein